MGESKLLIPALQQSGKEASLQATCCPTGASIALCSFTLLKTSGKGNVQAAVRRNKPISSWRRKQTQHAQDWCFFPSPPRSPHPLQGLILPVFKYPGSTLSRCKSCRSSFTSSRDIAGLGFPNKAFLPSEKK